MSTKPYYDKYFPNGLVDGSFSVEYLLCIWLNQDVTSEMLNDIGLVLDDEDGEVLGDYVLDGDQIVVQLFCRPAQGISMVKVMNYPTAGKRTSPP